MRESPKIILILNDIRSTHNVGNIFRTADVFAVEEIFLCGYTPAPSYDKDPRMPHISNKLNSQITKTALGAEKTVKFTVFETVQEAVNKAKMLGFKVAALEQNKTSTKLHMYSPPSKIALVLGNEIDGVDEWTIGSCDVILEIEQYGSKESLNVANAAAIALYALRTTNNNE